MKLDKLFKEEEKIREGISEIAQNILDMADYVLAKSVLELAETEIVGKRIRKACDKINDEVHHAKKELGKLLTEETKVKFKGSEKFLHEIENDLSLIHGDIESIGKIAENFFEAKDRRAAFDNMSNHYSELVQHVASLIAEGDSIKPNL